MALKFLIELFNMFKARISVEFQVVYSLVDYFITTCEVLVVYFLLTVEIILPLFNYFETSFGPILPIDVLL